MQALTEGDNQIFQKQKEAKSVQSQELIQKKENNKNCANMDYYINSKV